MQTSMETSVFTTTVITFICIYTCIVCITNTTVIWDNEVIITGYIVNNENNNFPVKCY